MSSCQVGTIGTLQRGVWNVVSSHVHVQIELGKYSAVHVKLSKWHSWSVECQEAAAGADNFNSLTALSHLPLIKTKYFNSHIFLKLSRVHFVKTLQGCIFFRYHIWPPHRFFFCQLSTINIFEIFAAKKKEHL